MLGQACSLSQAFTTFFLRRLVALIGILCIALTITALGLEDTTTFARRSSKKPNVQYSILLTKCHPWSLADNHDLPTFSSQSGSTAGKSLSMSAWCPQRRRRYFIVQPTHLRLPLSPGKLPRCALTLTIVARRVSSSNLSSSKCLEAGIKTPSISSKRSRPKDLDDGALQTLSLSNNSSSDSQLSFKEAMLPFCSSVTRFFGQWRLKETFLKYRVVS